jgi:DNA processing protein
MSACVSCQRRSWLLGALNGRLEYVGRSPTRLAALLELSDERLIEAVGGRESMQLLDRYEGLAPEHLAPAAGVQQVCHHDPSFPKPLAAALGPPRLLNVAGGLERLGELLGEPTVAIVGARAASDYGMEVAQGLARGLAASGVTVLSGLAEGIATAAHEGALEVAGARTVTVCAGGVDVSHPASRRSLQRRVCAVGCALAELPCGVRPRSWCHTARARIVVALASAVVVVEAGERPGELLHARLARETGAAVAAVPGRVTSPLSRGTHALLRDGAHLVRDAQDALDALYGVDGHAPPPKRRRRAEPTPELAPELRALLDEVAAGRDTVASLLATGAPERETLIGLARLECSGAVVRGDAGRYVARL